MNDQSPLEAVFFAALDLRSPQERANYLDEACAGDADLRQRVEKMLEAQAEAKSFLEPPAERQAATAAMKQMHEGPGTTIDAYTLLEEIGEGGFGVVYMAEQTEPVRRKVALKILKPGMDTRQVVARFEAERQALAIMDHPNIARVFDGGTTASGRPYFVMELVKGVPITEYCDQNHLAPQLRLELFATVCQAVQHAHQKGIIHRDLKPSNVLVSRHDTTPTVKVIDFGVAKALGPALTDKTLFTGVSQMIGTPLYMSPEQAGMSELDIDTRSDVYALGVLLYELLTGTTPFTQERFKSAAFEEIRRIIREEEPPTPSTRLSSSIDSLATISAQRHMEPAKLTRLVRGEIDWIVMKALEKDRNRRYETANGFAMDLQRHLAGEAVLAAPPSSWYRLRKFVRRNRGPALAAALILITLIGGVVGTTWQAMSAKRAWHEESLRAEGETRAKEAALAKGAEIKAVLDFVEKKILSAARPEDQEGGLGRDVTLRAAIESALPFVEAGFKDQPLLEARLRMTLATSFWYLSEEKIAVEHEEIARSLYEKHLGPDHADTLLAMNNLAVTYATMGRRADALKLREQTLAGQEKTLGPEHPDTLASMNNLADSYVAVGRYEEAVTLREKTLGLRQVTLGREHLDTLRSMNDLVGTYIRVGRFDYAHKLCEETLALRKVRLGLHHPDTLITMGNLAAIYGGLDRKLEGLKLREEVLALQKSKLGPDHRETLSSMNILASLYADFGRHADAIKLHEETVAVRRTKRGVDHPTTLTSMYNLANSYTAQGRHNDAIKLREETLPLQRSKLGADDFETLKSMNNLANNYAAVGKHAEELKLREETLALRKRKLGPSHADTVRAINNLARTLAICPDAKLRDPARALALAKSAVELDPNQSSRWNTLGMSHYRIGNWKESLAALRKSMELGKGGDGFDFFFAGMAHWKLGDKIEARRFYDRAVEWMKKNKSENINLREVQKEAAALLEIERKRD